MDARADAGWYGRLSESVDTLADAGDIAAALARTAGKCQLSDMPGSLY